jgi:hypothetical protein
VRLEVRYSALKLISRMFLGIGFGLFFWFCASELKPTGLFTSLGFIAAASFAMLALVVLYRLLFARARTVVAIDVTGVEDVRLVPTIIPWSAIRSVSLYTPYKATKATGISLAIDPAFARDLPIRLGAKLFRWINLSFGSNFIIDLGTLDVEVDEVLRAAKSYISK